jgi:hypothetical protein
VRLSVQILVPLTLSWIAKVSAVFGPRFSFKLNASGSAVPSP